MILAFRDGFFPPHNRQRGKTSRISQAHTPFPLAMVGIIPKLPSELLFEVALNANVRYHINLAGTTQEPVHLFDNPMGPFEDWLRSRLQANRCSQAFDSPTQSETSNDLGYVRARIMNYATWGTCDL